MITLRAQPFAVLIFLLKKAMKLTPLQKGVPWPTQDPFLFCVHHLDHYPAGNEHMGIDKELLLGRSIGSDFDPNHEWRMYHGSSVPGFPAHPHCGFETITFVRQGYIDHSDSLGAAARFGEGDVQWMTAGSGVQHSEMFPLLNKKESNSLELFQIWLNLPKKAKSVPPYFQMLWEHEIPKFNLNGVKIELIYGSLESLIQQKCPPDSWAAETENELCVAHFQMDEATEISIPSSKNSVIKSLYLYEGGIEINKQLITEAHQIILDSSKTYTICSKQKSKILLLQSKPINEPVAKYGPFVMNEQNEINQKINEFRLTFFGGWPWSKNDHTHSSSLERFAKYPDGKTQKP